ncbi:aldehyde dehydrogenase [Guggenheimella bovis]
MNIHQACTLARRSFESGITRSVDFRISELSKLERGIRENKGKICEALKRDLNKSPYESTLSEIGLVLGEIEFMKKHLKSWAKPEKLKTAMTQAPAQSYQLSEPYGVVLVMSPWNYPFQLCINPLIGAMAAGNAVVVKPSAYSPNVSEVIKEIIENYLDPGLFQVITGGREENKALLEERFDYIFFTGNPVVGRVVMEAASKHLTPVTLELGGKSPCIVEKSADLKQTAKRILFGKLMNSGQTCVAPDYILVDQSIKKRFVKELIKVYKKMLPSKEYIEKAFPKIISEKHLARLKENLVGQTILFQDDRMTKEQFPFTLVDEPALDSKIMQEEIFGPIFPILSYKNIDEVVRFVNEREKPLALYLFTKDEGVEEKILQCVSFGGGCVNDTLVHLSSPYMPFGGVGNSGMGSYHGKRSFDTFSHKKSIVKKSWYFDLPIRYHPYKNEAGEPPEFIFKG